MKQQDKPNSASASGRIGLTTLRATLKQFIAEGIEWEITGGPNGKGITLEIPSFDIITGADGLIRIVEGDGRLAVAEDGQGATK